MGIWSEIKETVEDVVEGVADWFAREEETPEILVLGAELHCMYGSKNTYLIVNEENIRFNGLPAACVLDRAESDNIMYFGVCHQNGYCSDLMKLRERWENEEPQNAGLNGEEFITTESVLICERCGGRIQAVNSGQDRIGAERLNQELSLMTRMKYQYPGLLEVISDPNGSLYLTEGMYDKAMAFVRECWENNGCNMEIISLFDQSSPEREMMRNVMERLLKNFDMSAVDKFRDDLSWKGTEKGYDGVPGWNVDVLNQEMFLLLEDECEITKKRLEEEPFYRLREEHRNFMYTLSDAATLLSYFVVANKGFGSNKVVEEEMQIESEFWDCREPVPEKVKEILKAIKEQNGVPPKGYKGGKIYKNEPTKPTAQKLPEGVTYREYDVNPKIQGQSRGEERLVIGDDGSAWYTKNHYDTFIRVE